MSDVETIDPARGRIQWAEAPEGDEGAGGLVAHYVERELPNTVPLDKWALSKLTKLIRAAWTPQEGSQEAFLTAYHVAFEVMISGTRGGGKGLPLDEPVYTPTGVRRIGDLRVGDLVACPDGTSSPITGVFPQGERQVYELEFFDGSIARCDDQHIWNLHVGGLKSSPAGTFKNYTMDKVLRMFRETEYRLSVPLVQVVDMQACAPMPIEPYALGLFLGDGSCSQAMRYCTVDDELAQHMVGVGFRETKSDRRNSLRNFTASREFKAKVEALGIAHTRSATKFVPPLYLHQSAASRLALLQGLMDTDGTMDSRGHMHFCSTSNQLARDVQYLARSLGARATLTAKQTSCNGKLGQPSFVVYIQTGNKFMPFRLRRKVVRHVPYMHEHLSNRIVRITELPKAPTVCIKIADSRGLFITRDFVVTHNTDTLLMDFYQHVGQGYGAEWRGILFRRSYPELADIINKSKKWFRTMCPGAKYNKVEHTWTFPDGEQLLLRHMSTPDDYWSYHGHAYPWIAFEELCNWPDLKCYTVMMSCSRSTRPGMPRCYRATTNPYGPNHNNVKRRFQLPHMFGVIRADIVDPESGEKLPPRLAINSSIFENKILLHADPDYVNKIRAAARNPAELAAWVYGSWDIVAGGMFDDLYDSQVHVVPAVPLELIPRRWRMDRAFDWGSSKPFSVGWFAESNGEPFTFRGRTYGAVRGDTYMVAEWYGWNGQRNEGLRMQAGAVGQGILDREDDWGIRHRVKPGPADSAIHDEENGKSIEGDMAQVGCLWQLADKSPGSRKQGWQQIRKMLAGSVPKPGIGREEPGLFIFDTCEQAIELFQGTPRDEKDLDDVDTDAEDHFQDMLRYRCRKLVRTVRSTKQ